MRRLGTEKDRTKRLAVDRAASAGAGLSLLMALALAPSANAAVILGAAGNFTVLGLANQACAGCATATVTINSATSIIGNVGYSAGVVSTTNQKVKTFSGTSFVAGTADFQHKAATYQPTGGIRIGTANPNVAPFGSVNDFLAQANADALAASAAAAALAPTTGPLGNVSNNLTINSTGDVNVIPLSSLSYNNNTLTLSSRSGRNDHFIFNISGAGDHTFDFAQSVISFGGTGTTADHVLFNFTGGTHSALTGININKSRSVFNGTILSPFGNVTYHNPASFSGAIIGYRINLHSSFNISQSSFVPPPTASIPEPGAWLLMIGGLGFVGARLRRQRACRAPEHYGAEVA